MLLYIIIFILVLGFVSERVFSWLNFKNRRRPLPVEIKPFFKDSELKKSFLYAIANRRFSFVSSLFSLVVVVAFILLSGFDIVNNFALGASDNIIWQSLIFFAILYFANDIITTPFELCSTFGIESRFGFNKTTVKTYIFDKLKSWMLAIILGGGLLALFVWFYDTMGERFWLYLWIAFSAFSLFMAVFHTSIILPLFNKLTPLEDGELKTAIREFCNRVDFQLSDVYILDGSKRSTKGNAFFSGMGKRKKIVLYDNILEQLTVKEIVAVLAHEIGHYKHKHIQKSIVLSVLQTGVTFWVLSLFLSKPILSEAIGVENHTVFVGLVAFSLLFSPISSVVGFLFNLFSRFNEYQADEFAAVNGCGDDLISGLGNLTVKNYSHPNPHPYVVFCLYSHPTLVQRLNSIKKRQ
jgi:STE24 endopeptidase